MDTDQKIISKSLSVHPETTINVIEKWSNQEIVALIESLPIDLSAEVAAKLSPYHSGKAFQVLSLEKSTALINILPTKVSSTILLQVNKDMRDQILGRIDNEIAQSLLPVLNHPKETVGAHLDPSPLIITNDQKAGDTLEVLRREPHKLRSNIFVVDRSVRLVGFVEIKDLLSSDSESTIDTILRKAPKSLLVSMQIRQALMQWDHAFPELPVVDTDGLFMGVVSKDQSNSDELDIMTKQNHALIDAGKALGELYMIGLNSLLGNHSQATTEDLN